MRCKFKFFVCLVIACTFLTIKTVHAQAFNLFKQIGILNQIDLTQGKAIIYDADFRLPQETPVYRFSPGVDNTDPKMRHREDLQALKPGMRVGYTAAYRNDTDQDPMIQEVWILPPGTFRQSSE